MKCKNILAKMATFPKEAGKYHRVIFTRKTGSKRKTKTFYFRKDDFTRTEVAEWKKRKEIALKDSVWSPWEQEQINKSIPFLGDLIKEYKQRMKSEYADSTYQVRCYYLELFRDQIGNRQIQHITAQVSNAWINDSSLRFPTKKNRKKTLQVFFGWIQKAYGIRIDGLEVIAKQSEKQKYYNKQHTHFITEQQLEQVLQNVTGTPRSVYSRTELKDFYRLAFYTTRRRSDLLHIKPEWIFDHEPLLKLGDDFYKPKSQIIEYVPLLDVAWKLLIEYKHKGASPIFSFTADFVTKQFKKAVKQTLPSMKDKISLHSLRSSGIMYLIYEKDLPLKHVMQMTGHKDLRSLQIYTRPWFEKTLQQLKNNI